MHEEFWSGADLFASQSFDSTDPFAKFRARYELTFSRRRTICTGNETCCVQARGIYARPFPLGGTFTGASLNKTRAHVKPRGASRQNMVPVKEAVSTVSADSAVKTQKWRTLAHFHGVRCAESAATL